MKTNIPTYPAGTFCIEQVGGGAGYLLLDTLIESHDDMAVYCGWTSYRIRTLNSAAARFLGVTKQEAVGKGFFELMPAQFAQGDLEEIASLKNDREQVVELLLNTADDKAFNVKVAAMDDGVLFIIKGVSKVADNSEETNFKMLFENMSSGFVFLKGVTDDRGNITNHQILDINSAFEIYFDKDKDQAIGKNIDDIIPDIDESVMRILTKSALTGNSYSGKYYHPSTKKHFEVRTYSPRKGFSAAVFNDIKHEIEVRNDLIIKNEISKAFALGHDVSLYKVVLDFIFKTTESRGGFIGYVHQSKEVICLAHNDQEKLPPIDEHGDLKLPIQGNGLEEVLSTKEQLLETDTWGCREILTTPVMDGDKVIGIICCSDPARTYDFKSKNFVKGLADYMSPLMVAEIKERLYKRQLVEEKERAERNEKLKTAFLANMSHEVRTPMNSIIGFGQLLAKSPTLSSKDKLYVDYISQASKRLLYIIENIMEMSKLQTQQSKATISSVNVNSMLKTIYNEMETFAHAKHIDLIAMPSVADDDSNIVTDSYKVKKTLTCLISNGIKFTSKGSVSYGYNIDGSFITFFVRDTGIGIRKELHESIFTSFQQAENVLERKYDGVGVGLSLCKGYIDILGGSIWLESSPNEGSTFYFRLKNLDVKPHHLLN
ncbi:MAG: PAS domain-containing protein [Bacteroidales bacterium]|nr:PAS domain-containing protein [Bacteroidales bacterium]